jgi:hypothetical protein
LDIDLLCRGAASYRICCELETCYCFGSADPFPLIWIDRPPADLAEPL